MILPCVLYAALAIAALMLAPYSQPALFVIAGVALGLLMIGIRNSWDTVIYLVTGGHQHSETEP